MSKPPAYDDLVCRYGREMAFDILLTVEKLAEIQGNLETIDEPARFDRAIAAFARTTTL